MDCPVCKTPTMVKEKVLGQITLDKCTNCQGVMFEKAELGYYLQFNKDIPDFAKVISEAKQSQKNCCFCQVPMVEFKYASDMDLMVDFCKKCEAIWLDGGEINQLTDEASDPQNFKNRIAKAVFKMRQKSGQSNLPLTCPVCDTTSMRAFKTSENVEIDMCDKCHGVFFEKGELADAVELSVDIPQFSQVVAAAQASDKNCPRCDIKLVEFEYAEGTGLMIDYCKKCSGIWLDRGELSRVEDLAPELESLGKRFGKLLTDMHEQGYTFM